MVFFFYVSFLRLQWTNFCVALLPCVEINLIPSTLFFSKRLQACVSVWGDMVASAVISKLATTRPLKCDYDDVTDVSDGSGSGNYDTNRYDTGSSNPYIIDMGEDVKISRL